MFEPSFKPTLQVTLITVWYLASVLFVIMPFHNGNARHVSAKVTYKNKINQLYYVVLSIEWALLVGYCCLCARNTKVIQKVTYKNKMNKYIM